MKREHEGVRGIPCKSTKGRSVQLKEAHGNRRRDPEGTLSSFSSSQMSWGHPVCKFLLLEETLYELSPLDSISVTVPCGDTVLFRIKAHSVSDN